MIEATTALAKQAHATAARLKGSPLWSYYESLAEGFDELIDGNPDQADCVPFTCYQCIRDDKYFDSTLVEAFREEWAKDIGWASGIITSISADLKAALDPQ